MPAQPVAPCAPWPILCAVRPSLAFVVCIASTPGPVSHCLILLPLEPIRAIRANSASAVCFSHHTPPICIQLALDTHTSPFPTLHFLLLSLLTPSAVSSSSLRIFFALSLASPSVPTLYLHLPGPVSPLFSLHPSDKSPCCCCGRCLSISRQSAPKPQTAVFPTSALPRPRLPPTPYIAAAHHSLRTPSSSSLPLSLLSTLLSPLHPFLFLFFFTSLHSLNSFARYRPF